MISHFPLRPLGFAQEQVPRFRARIGVGLGRFEEQNRRRNPAYFEDFATEDQPQMARRWDAKMGSKAYFRADP